TRCRLFAVGLPLVRNREQFSRGKPPTRRMSQPSMLLSAPSQVAIGYARCTPCLNAKLEDLGRSRSPEISAENICERGLQPALRRPFRHVPHATANLHCDFTTTTTRP